MKAKYKELPPIRKDRCGTPSPIRLNSIGGKQPVAFKPAATLSCQMLVPLKRWIEKGLQPLADKLLASRVTTISVMSSYSCRTRYGRKGARMSEHAFANALDIGDFKLASGERVSVLKHWGQTKRDIAKAAATQKQKEQTISATSSNPTPNKTKRSDTSPSAATNKLPEVRIPRPRAVRTKSDVSRTTRQTPKRTRATTITAPLRQPAPITEPQNSMPPLPTRRPLRVAVRPLTSVKPAYSPSTVTKERRLKPPHRLGGPNKSTNTPQALFLRGAHRTACRIFGTTLGPEANEAHRNHFHIDMFPRRRRGYCE